MLAAIASNSAVHDAVLAALHAAEEVIAQRPIIGAVVFVLVAACSALFTFLSIAVVVPAAVVTWGAPLTILLLWLGWLLGGAATYSIGRYFGRAVVQWLTAREVLSGLEARVRRDTPFWAVVLLQLALPSEVTGYLFGLLRYRAAAYLAALALAEAPYTLATVYLGASFVRGHGIGILAVGLLIATIAVVALVAARRTLAESNGLER